MIYRITGYNPKEDFCFIIDCNGAFEKLWQFSAFLVSKGLKVLEVSTEENFTDINISMPKQNPTKLILRATVDGKPEYVTQTINGQPHTAMKVGNKMYVINKSE